MGCDMEINFDLIRECLVDYARQLGRPEYEPCVVRRVKRSFQFGMDDPLKPVISQMMEDRVGRNVNNRRRELLTEFCKKHNTGVVSHFSGIPQREIGKLIKGYDPISNERWAKLLDAFEEIENEQA